MPSLWATASIGSGRHMIDAILCRRKSVPVRHRPSLLESAISTALDEAGFEIYNVIRDTTANIGPSGDSQIERSLQEQDGWLEQVVERWRMRSKPDSEVEKRKRDTHLGRCDICRAETSEKADHSLKDAERLAKFNAVVARCVVSAGAVNEPVVVIDSLPSSKLTKVTVSIVRMTCGTCVGKISEALEAKPWSRSVNVSLLTNSAVVTVVGGEHLADIVQTIQDGGYEATLERVDEANPLRETWSERLSDTLRASYAVGGMTCSTCIGNITEALQKHGWVKRVDINLISNSATVLFEGRDNLQAIADTIEDVGYNATLNDMIELERAQHQVKGRRVIAIRVTGMFCDHCPSRIHNSLEEFGQRLTIEKPLSIADPIVKVSYLPDAPEFTIRRILASISTVGPTLETSIYQSPTLEERSRMIHVREQRRLWLRTAFSVTVAIPTFIIAIAFGSLAPSQNRVRQFLMHPVWSGQVKRVDWALLFMATATPVYLFAADIFHRRALKEIQAMWRRRSPTPVLQRFYRFGSMNMLMSLSTSIAYISSVVGLVMAAMRSSYMASENSGSAYFDSVVFLTMFILLGKSIEAYSRSKTGDAVTMLGKLRPSEAILVDPYSGGSRLHNFYHEQRTRYVAVDVLEFGDIVKVSHGGSPPCDGVILEGESKFDESSLTGESKLVRKSVSDEICSGSINKDPAVSIRISSISGETMLDQIMQVVREGQTRRAPVERLADLLTSYFVPAVTLCAISIWIIWLSLGLSVALPRDYLGVGIGGWLLWSLQFAIAVFVIACPCGIALAAPTALFVGGGLAARNGILVKGGGEAFQEARGLDRIVFDKTGTLTRGGEPVITDYEFVSHEDDSLVRAVVQRLEESSSHPIAKALVSFCDSNEMREVEARDTEEIAGEGMRGAFTTKSMRKEHVLVLVGDESLMADYNVHIPVHIVQTINTWKAQGKPIALVAINTSPRDISLCEPGQNVSPAWKMVMICAVSDPPRPEAFAIVDALERRGMDVWMMSGDNPTTATAVGDTKVEKIQYLQKSQQKSKSRNAFGITRKHAQRATIAMVGDGINGAPALSIADVGIAIGSGSDIAIASADFILVSSHLDSLLTLIDLSRAVFRRIKFNFGWALVYNLVALPVAAGVLYSIKNVDGHVRLDPVWASLAMALSSVSVVCSSLLLRSGLPGVGFRQEALRRN